MIALALNIGFYGLSIAVILLLLFGPAFLIWATAGAVVLLAPLLLFSVVSGLMILWNILPRHQRFQVPGPKLQLSDHPPLQNMIQELATATGQRPPDEVYLLMESNAWVQESVFWWGLYRRRRMGIGLPLLHLLTTDEFRAVLAHEYGHYHARDTQLAGSVFRTRETIRRARESTGEVWVHALFRWYAHLYLQITQGISRQQEHQADLFAARLTHPDTMVQALEKLEESADLFAPYWETEVLPLLELGRCPPVLEGYDLYIQSLAAQNPKKTKRQTDPYDSHPSTPQRIEALQGMRPAETQSHEGPALDLLGHPADLEARFLQWLLPDKPTLPRIPWTEVGPKVLAPLWAAHCERFMPAFHSMGFRLLAETLTSRSSKHALLRQLRLEGHDPDDQDQQWSVIQRVVALALKEQNWMIQALPGTAVICVQGQTKLNPFEDVLALQKGQLEPENWLRILLRAGVDVERPLLQGPLEKPSS